MQMMVRFEACSVELINELIVSFTEGLKGFIVISLKQSYILKPRVLELNNNIFQEIRCIVNFSNANRIDLFH